MTGTTTLRHVRWRGTDDPGRLDTAEAELGPGWLLARGESVTREYRLSWTLTTVEDWVTESLEVSVGGGGWSRRLWLRRSADGDWSAEAESNGDPDLPAPGLIDPVGLLGAVDCDLGLCPLTNTMPILRSGLHTAAPGPRHELLMAWVDVPSLAVLPSRQSYQQLSGPEHGVSTVRFDSLDDHFRADLTVDADGLVLDYPELARRI